MNGLTAKERTIRRQFREKVKQKYGGWTPEALREFQAFLRERVG